jgi:hypothetical protein
MRTINNNDNLFNEGSIVIAKVNLNVKLIITKYNQRIYYCTPVEKLSGKLQAFYERELRTVDESFKVLNAG